MTPRSYLPEFATFEGEHAPRTSAGARVFAVESTRAPYLPRSRECERRAAVGEDPRSEEKSKRNPEIKKKTIWYMAVLQRRAPGGELSRSDSSAPSPIIQPVGLSVGSVELTQGGAATLFQRY